jgi:hypothetical protein
MAIILFVADKYGKVEDCLILFPRYENLKQYTARGCNFVYKLKQSIMYPQEIVIPMEKEEPANGFEELLSPADVEKALTKPELPWLY